MVDNRGDEPLLIFQACEPLRRGVFFRAGRLLYDVHEIVNSWGELFLDCITSIAVTFQEPEPHLSAYEGTRLQYMSIRSSAKQAIPSVTQVTIPWVTMSWKAGQGVWCGLPA